MPINLLSEIGSFFFIAIALGMDAFSVSLVLGMQNMRFKIAMCLSLFIGVCHMILPTIGVLLGQALLNKIGHVTTLLSGLLLFGIGIHMFLSAFTTSERKTFRLTGYGFILLALSVSMDSFSVGLSFGMSGIYSFMMILLFGFVSSFLTLLGLLIGRKISGMLSLYSELLGGSILIVFGLTVMMSAMI
ncbi:putative Mn2+ efflux pump MntP [Cerasibacillus quisquiliarum]|uniref:Putative manganese efflux pump MntP n=1 Tax=Cerasibacillus quisquiliarum TaxID=227865 RepID=A0A511V2G5_9BACI|nr:manganese efflux pump [Cerasibacillus quisquiliarum]MBB5147114.1 putative Mn2+ efflux pump MntP [Cerasibacillus quisquiliarum]GEN32078.1 putative manganese efflux pump MntP [Cerasibacillus quisquiliarum]